MKNAFTEYRAARMELATVNEEYNKICAREDDADREFSRYEEVFQRAQQAVFQQVSESSVAAYQAATAAVSAADKTCTKLHADRHQMGRRLSEIRGRASRLEGEILKLPQKPAAFAADFAELQQLRDRLKELTAPAQDRCQALHAFEQAALDPTCSLEQVEGLHRAWRKLVKAYSEEQIELLEQQIHILHSTLFDRLVREL